MVFLFFLKKVKAYEVEIVLLINIAARIYGGVTQHSKR